MIDDVRLAPDELEAAGIRTVVVATPDLQGRLVGRRIPVEGFGRVVANGVDICTCAWAWDIEQGLGLIEGNHFALCGMQNGVPDVTLVPDLDTLRPAAWLDGVAICLADPVDVKTHEPMALSPRVILKQELARLRGLGLTPLAGTELEFYLFKNEPRQLRQSGFRDLDPTTLIPSDFMIHEGNVYEPFFQKLRSDLRASGILVEAAQSEWGTGQWEMTFEYGDPLEMADRHALYKLAVRDSAARAGMSATFMARPLNGQPGSSCHVHVSFIDEAGTPVFWDEQAPEHMSDTMRSAVAGALEHAPGLMGWYAPTINSYRRNNSDEVAGNGRTWGFDNRTTSVRVVGHSAGALRFEFRLPGADTNPYFTLTGVLASARDGIEKSTPAPEPVRGSAYDLPADEAMPRHLGEAAAAFASSELVASILDEESIRHQRILLDHEWNTFLAAVSDWDLARYFDRI
ncbi:glutamine synthetase family protein [Agromyces aerolatus]|uniref:glutamine synthetase family protein n=1 Tax=Agromyces sp. LY-1074 TaxID=3074080 RepID=UPI002859B768|nr:MULTISPECIES: glutamine synthetase family protein [unclassified Agromyces]MDR5700428.1 glutamine synthetase family protein [Agromyces sp. LY-1074]MDR5706949.1 glutamine synthetase family protein [Agromyces sp. LY-1358]